MSYLRKMKATCGRHVPKPNESDDNVNYDDDTSLPIQDQIDNLRAKIYLKEKYNKALKEEVSETNDGAATMITELVNQNKKLHEDLQYEKNAEKYAVKKALRSYRLFQLAVTEKDAESVINWLDDKIFDCAKTLNEGIYLLKKMQEKLQEAEKQVYYMESCPVPGTEPWERKAEDAKVSLESAIENTKANRDAALLLNKKYQEILFQLKGERGKWPNIMATMEKTLSQLKSELAGLEIMLEDANRFRDEASEKLKITEEEASANRKQRRSQMSKMKKSVERALEANTAKYTPESLGIRMGRAVNAMSVVVSSQSVALQKCIAQIKLKQAEVVEFENRANRLVEVMRVPDLRHCPKRLGTVRKVTEILNQELELKEQIKDFLLKHKYRLELILKHFKYTGCLRDEKFTEDAGALDEKLNNLLAEIKAKELDRTNKGEILCNLRLALIGLEEVFNNGKKRSEKLNQREDVRVTLKRQLEKLKVLVANVNELNSQFPEDSKPQRSYAPFVKYPIQNRHVRVGGMDEQDVDDDSDDGDTIDSKIPNREEIKSKSEKIYSQGMLRRGLK